MLWSTCLNFSFPNFTVKAQRYNKPNPWTGFEPAQVQFPPPSYFCMYWDTGHPYTQQNATFVITYSLKHTWAADCVEVCVWCLLWRLQAVESLCDWRYLEQDTQRHKTHTRSHIRTESCSKSSRELMDRPMIGSASCPAPYQSRRSVTEGSSSSSCDSTPAIWVTGLPRRSRRFSLGQEASGWRSASAEISVHLG